MSVTDSDKKLMADHLGISVDELEKVIATKVQQIIETKVAKWKSEGKTGISKVLFDQTVSNAVDEILEELKVAK